MIYRRFKEWLEKKLTSRQVQDLVWARNQVKTIFSSSQLVKLAVKFRTDKWNHHWYIQHYEKHFHSLRKKKQKILEIGIGGYDSPDEGGNSLRMWKAYFPKSLIFGIDIYDKKKIEEDRIKTFQGSQDDPVFLKKMAQEVGGFDIIIDDGSHINKQGIASFETLFPFLSVGGIYAIEDVQTSYWPGFGGSSEKFDDPKTVMGYFKALLDGLNHEEFIRPGYVPSYWDKNITAIHFYHNLIFIFKGENNEGSGIKNNRTDVDWILREEALRKLIFPEK